MGGEWTREKIVVIPYDNYRYMLIGQNNKTFSATFFISLHQQQFTIIITINGHHQDHQYIASTILQTRI